MRALVTTFIRLAACLLFGTGLFASSPAFAYDTATFGTPAHPALSPATMEMAGLDKCCAEAGCLTPECEDPSLCIAKSAQRHAAATAGQGYDLGFPPLSWATKPDSRESSTTRSGQALPLSGPKRSILFCSFQI